MTVRDSGSSRQVFDEEKLRALQGEMAIGHVRYSTTGSSAWENAQPVWRSDRRQVALAHNGNLINAVELHAELRERGVQFRGTSDSEIIAALLSTHAATHRGRGGRGDAAARGRLLDRGHDQGRASSPSAIRPGCGRSRSASSATATASRPRAARSTSSAPSSCARCSRARWSSLGERGHRDAPGGRAARGTPSASSSTSTSRGPDSMPRGQPVLQESRRRMGEILWREAPVDADLVIAVPDSGNPAAAATRGRPASRRTTA